MLIVFPLLKQMFWVLSCLKTHNTCFGREVRKLIFKYALLSGDKDHYHYHHAAYRCLQTSLSGCISILTLKTPRKMHLKCRLLKSSAANNCLALLMNKYRSKQRGPRIDCSYRSSLIWVHTVCTLFAIEDS